jgi:2-oxoglutarate dehydrogenase E2 component (dihydrolipoamide succinyltransferase)
VVLPEKERWNLVTFALPFFPESMSAVIELKMPKMGESVAEATIIKWLKKEGERVQADEPIVEIATDKVDSEVPSTASGYLLKKMFKEGDVVKVGQTIALIGEKEGQQTMSVPGTQPAPDMVTAGTVTVTPPVKKDTTSTSRFYSPLVKTIAREENITLSELDTIAGSGADGRVTKRDLLAYIEKKKTTRATPAVKEQPPAAEVSPVESPVYVPPTPRTDHAEIIEMDRMRKLIAEHMVMSKRTSAHVTSFVEADVTNLVLWRERVKNEFEKREGEKLTFTPLFIEAVVRAIKDFPMINASVDGTKIIIHKEIHIGMATALPNGNLIVPVIRNADRMNLVGLTRAVNDLAARARANKLLPDEIQGGTYTLTNVGIFGNVMGTPIINQPQVAILATGAIRKKPAVIETPQGDAIAIRHMMFLSHTYDHRIIDGALGGSFVRRVADYLENFDMNRSI